MKEGKKGVRQYLPATAGSVCRPQPAVFAGYSRQYLPATAGIIWKMNYKWNTKFITIKIIKEY